MHSVSAVRPRTPAPNPLPMTKKSLEAVCVFVRNYTPQGGHALVEAAAKDITIRFSNTTGRIDLQTAQILVGSAHPDLIALARKRHENPIRLTTRQWATALDGLSPSFVKEALEETVFSAENATLPTVQRMKDTKDWRSLLSSIGLRDRKGGALLSSNVRTCLRHPKMAKWGAVALQGFALAHTGLMDERFINFIENRDAFGVMLCYAAGFQSKTVEKTRPKDLEPYWPVLCPKRGGINNHAAMHFTHWQRQVGTSLADLLQNQDRAADWIADSVVFHD